MRVGVIVFPGSNGDIDVYHFFKDGMQIQVEYIWHKERNLRNTDLVVLPGGFSYGDYLRPGAIARHTTVMSAVEEHASRGGLVLGICNGFQILTEAGMLPGGFLRNHHLQFRCQFTPIRVENRHSPFTGGIKPGRVLHLPVANGDGNYFLDSANIQKLEDKNQIVFRYTDFQGKSMSSNNPTGSVDNVAGVCNQKRNVLGMMPHPERAWANDMGGRDGLELFHSLLNYWKGKE